MDTLNDDVKAMLNDLPAWMPLDSAPQSTWIIVSNARRNPRLMGLGRCNGNGWDVQSLGGWTSPTAEEITHWLPLSDDEPSPRVS
jgi:hypothetical protein